MIPLTIHSTLNLETSKSSKMLRGNIFTLPLQERSHGSVYEQDRNAENLPLSRS